MMSLFVFFTTTMSVSFTLRETQTRMLKFTGLSFFNSKQLMVSSHLCLSTIISVSISIRCSAASTPCSASVTNVSVDLCARDWIPRLCSGTHIYIYILSHSNISEDSLNQHYIINYLNFADYDWDSVLPVWVLRWSAVGFHGSSSCLAMRIIHPDKVFGLLFCLSQPV